MCILSGFLIRGRWIVLFVLLAAAGGAAYYQYADPRNRDGGPEFAYVQPDRGDVVQAIRASGQLNPVRKVQVGSQISGNIAELHADFNSRVRKGDLVAKLDTATFDANVALKRAELESARAALALVRLNRDRLRSLKGRGLVPDADLDATEAEFEQAESLVRIRESSLRMSEIELERCYIHSPTDGIVISRNVDVGQTVAASMSAPVLFEIAEDLARMKINTHVPEADIGGVVVGQRVEFRVDAYRDERFEGEVSQIRNAPLMVDNVVTYDTVVLVDNSDLRLKPGMTAEVHVITEEREDALRLRNTALRARLPDAVAVVERERPEDGDWRRVYLHPVDGPLEERWVRIGISDGVHSEVLEGVSENDKLVTGLAVRATADRGRGDGPSFLRGRQAQY
ncbi:MAG: efflux RND transporter periplasmic adaptor subunit [Opitutales bacterium]|nr:efflux RND transporter periplasmic adaptor subunit [Opitutales bacterium]